VTNGVSILPESPARLVGERLQQIGQHRDGGAPLLRGGAPGIAANSFSRWGVSFMTVLLVPSRGVNGPARAIGWKQPPGTRLSGNAGFAPTPKFAANFPHFSRNSWRGATMPLAGLSAR
jgi:hypothetical protein